MIVNQLCRPYTGGVCINAGLDYTINVPNGYTIESIEGVLVNFALAHNISDLPAVIITLIIIILLFNYHANFIIYYSITSRKILDVSLLICISPALFSSLNVMLLYLDLCNWHILAYQLASTLSLHVKEQFLTLFFLIVDIFHFLPLVTFLKSPLCRTMEMI